ncbi:oxidoreductase family protein [Pseudoalteromonas sp. ND6B]|uniref:oxidoreductase family protein n=1 Tax=Pseudoalteromonas sp. ND6B TaxID=1535421 RepID=UPI00051A8920|nr:oxidoreductase family protein [Pseudoalteromonas sp. ND6B]
MSSYLPLLTPYFERIAIGETLTSLWSGCGQIVKCQLDEQACVIKAIKVPDHINHSKIKQSAFALNRKRDSYHVEYTFYQQFSHALPKQAAAIECIKAINKGDEFALVFKDFSKQGYTQATTENIKAILKWLAQFHAFHLNATFDGLWEQGSYWHLDTRPDEFNNLPKKSDIKQAATQLNNALKQCDYQTLIHGDAKLANFAANSQGHIRGYDFQYVGAGVGVVDVMYFMTSCLDDSELHKHAQTYLDYYFSKFKKALSHYQPAVNADDVIAQWAHLWPVAWADFYRFLLGWSPEHKKINGYMQAQVNNWLASNNS